MKYILFLSLLLIFNSCNDGKPSTNTTSKNEKITKKIDKLRDKDLSHLSSDQKSKWTFLTLGYFQKEVELKGGNVLNMDSIADQWIKFHDDNTYSIGNSQDLLAGGNWRYDHDLTLLELENDNVTAGNLEYKVLSKDDYIVLVGTSKYGNNGQQIKCVRVRD